MSTHALPLRTYLTIFGTLIVLTAATVGAAFLDLGPLNTVVALLIAAVKASLVALFFMHLKYSPRMIWIVAAAGLLWFAFLMVLTFQDVMTRGWVAIPAL